MATSLPMYFLSLRNGLEPEGLQLTMPLQMVITLETFSEECSGRGVLVCQHVKSKDHIWVRVLCVNSLSNTEDISWQYDAFACTSTDRHVLH